MKFLYGHKSVLVIHSSYVYKVALDIELVNPKPLLLAEVWGRVPANFW